MKRLLIADDEPRQRHGLAKLIHSIRPDLTILEAANGQDALNLVKKENPDAVLSDIRMPLLDGLQLSEKLLDINPNIAIAYVSAYKDFNYATRALRMGAVEYLLKPYTCEQLEETLKTLEQHVVNRQETQKVYRHLDHTIDAWNDQKLMALLTRDLTAGERTELETILPLHRSGYVLWVQVVDEGLEDWPADKQLDSREQLKYWFTKLLPDLTLCVASQEEPRLAGVYTGFLSLAELEEQLTTLLREMAAGFPAHVLVCLSDQMQSVGKDAQRAFKQARFAAGFRFYLPEGGLVLYRTIEEARNRELPYLFRFEQQLLQTLQEASEDGLDDIIREMFAFLNPVMRYVPGKLVRRLNQIAGSALSGIENRLPKDVFQQLWADAAAVFSELNGYRPLCDGFEQLMHSAVRAQAREHGDHTEEYIQSIIAYIQSHYAQPLSLCELGERFYFSPNYLSALVKSRTGVSFKQYLQTLRMEAAEALLRDSDKKVADVAQAVGFPDPSYFNRIFKKQYGVSPDIYRRNMKSRLTGGGCDT